MIPIYQPRVYKESALQALESGWVSSQGSFLDLTVEALKKLFHMPYVVLMNNGTSATHMLLKAIQFKNPSCKTIYVPNNVFIAVWNCVQYDVGHWDMKVLEMDPQTLNMRTDDEYICNLDHGAAVMIVHNVGNIINVPRLKRLRPDLIFVEDNCEGMFGKYEGIYSGTSTASLCSSVSFFANKIISCGEGGAFFTHDKDVYDYIYTTIHHGLSGKKYIYKTLGYNYRMTNVQAALLYDQIMNIESILYDKKQVFDTYSSRFANGKLIFAKEEENTQKAMWMMCVGIRGKSYDEVESYMRSKGIDIRPFFYDIQEHAHYNDVPRQKLDLSYTFFMLPSYPDLTQTQIEYITDMTQSLLN